MPGELDGNALRVFVAIVECQGFSAAAERLHKTQSTISQSLQRLEDIVGAPLIQRTSRSLSLTPAGETFLSYARQILKLHGEAIGALRAPGAQQCVHVGMPEDYAQHWLTDMLSSFQTRFSAVRPDICCEMSSSLVARLQRGELDLALGVEHANLPPGEFLCEEPLVWVAAPNWHIEAGAPVPLAVYAQGCAFRANAERALAESGRAWHVVYTSQSPRGIAAAIEQGHSVGIAARRLVPEGWQVLGAEEGFAPVEPARLVYWLGERSRHPAIDAWVAMFREQLGCSA
ncbi:LysR family transcriptional regulator [Pseudomonas sp. zjy_14]|uniref:LysR family transcriptional regulator n=1 Tax=Pseudomonas sp. zjy_14 TaxID=3367264 RepID=UPI00370AA782